MKKLIYTLGLALACGFAANADNASKSMQAMTPFGIDAEAIVSYDMSAVTFERVSPKLDKAARKPAATDFVGQYKWEGRNMLKGVAFPNAGIMKIYQDETDATGKKMLVDGLIQGYTLQANFDETTGFLVLPCQYVYTNTRYDQEVWLWNYTVMNSTDPTQEGYQIIPTDESHPFYFSMSSNGDLRAGNVDSQKWNDYNYPDDELSRDCCIGVMLMPYDPSPDSGFFWMCFGIKASSLSLFEYNPDEWVQIDNAIFKDAWLPIYFEQTPEYEVPLYYKKSAPNTFMLLNPYGPETPYGMELQEPDGTIARINIDPDREGYIMFTIHNPDLVEVFPLVYAITIDLRESEDAPVSPTPLTMFNNEGYSIQYENTDPNELLVYYIQNNLQVSRFDESNRVVYLYNPYISMTSNLAQAFYFGGEVNTNSGEIVLPQNYLDEVETIIGEENNAAPVYYNLQGVRLAQPEKGQLVIVRKGNTTTKQIAR